jgi:hypothetical protein
MKASVKLFVLGVLALGVGLFALEVSASEQLATPPAPVETTMAASQTANSTGDLAVDMNTWRETGFVTLPVSVSRPRRR